MRREIYMPKNFNTIKEYLTDEEKFQEALMEYNEWNEEIEPIYIYPEGYHELSEEEIKYCEELDKKVMEAFYNEDEEEEKRLQQLYPDFGPLPMIDIEKTLELVPDEDKLFFINKLEENSYREMIILKCLKCDYEEKVEYEFVEECWFEGPYPISYCPHCNKPKFVPLDIYNKKKNK